ncbi:MAG: hypothetical protein LQ345_000553 [Seirophora villosa]|nr:MAG: hypothetical protein LQ345_000553 [Seirophora villosa]
MTDLRYRADKPGGSGMIDLYQNIPEKESSRSPDPNHHWGVASAQTNPAARVIDQTREPAWNIPVSNILGGNKQMFYGSWLRLKSALILDSHTDDNNKKSQNGFARQTYLGLGKCIKARQRNSLSRLNTDQLQAMTPVETLSNRYPDRTASRPGRLANTSRDAAYV